MGRRTAQSVPPLPGREVICLTRKSPVWKYLVEIPKYKCIQSISDLLERNDDKNIMIAGGAQVYREVMTDEWFDNI
jgi:dihydrofolate reductase